MFLKVKITVILIEYKVPLRIYIFAPLNLAPKEHLNTSTQYFSILFQATEHKNLECLTTLNKRCNLDQI